MQNFQESVWAHLEAKNIDRLKELLNNADELDIINIMDELSNDEIVLIYRLLNKDMALEVFEKLDLNDQQNLINSFTEEKAIEVFKELGPDDRVRLLDELPAVVTRRMLAALSEGDRADISLIMGYEPETAGRLMTTEYVRLNKEWTAGEALGKLRNIAKEKETIYTLYITDTSKKLEGVLSLRELLVADPDAKISEIMQTSPIKVTTDTDQEEVANNLKKLELLALPVVDKEDRLVGIITVDDAMDILEDEATEDILASAGITDIASSETVRSEELIEGKLTTIWKMRLPILGLTLIAGLMAGAVIDHFEETLESVAIVAVFIPIIMDMGGSIGTQSSTIFARGLILGHIQTKSIWKHVLKESMVGLSLGIIAGSVTATAAYIWQGNLELSIVLALSLAFTMTIAAFLGFVVPYVLVKLKFDQATGTGPVITSIKDITGLMVYFLLVSFFLGHLM